VDRQIRITFCKKKKTIPPTFHCSLSADEKLKIPLSYFESNNLLRQWSRTVYSKSRRKSLPIFKFFLWIGFPQADDTDGKSEKKKMVEGSGWAVLFSYLLTYRAEPFLRSQGLTACAMARPSIYLYIYIYLWFYSLLLDLGRFFGFLILYTFGRSPLSGDQTVTRPLPIHRTTQIQNKCTQTSTPRVWFEPTIPAFEPLKTVHATVIGIKHSCWL
jgi:hypothetical protein